MSGSLAIIGTGMAGARLVESLIAEGYSGEITMFGEERINPYNRIQLSTVLAGEKTVEGLPLLTEEWYRTHNICLRSGDPVVCFDSHIRSLTTATGRQQFFDHVVIATGSRPFIPRIPGNNLPGVMAFRTLDDIAIMKSFAEQGAQALVVGGGLLGLEAAYGLNKLGLDVTVVHNSTALMNRQLDQRAAEMLKESLEGRGIHIVTNARTAAVTGTAQATGLQLEDGRHLAGELVVFATGITPNVELFARSGLEIGKGIVVDDQMRTSHPGIYALGECAEHNGVTVGIVAPIWDQASVLTSTLLGRPATYRPREYSTQLKVSGIDVFSAGNMNTDEHCRDIVLNDPVAGIYRRLVIRDNRLQAALLFGDKSLCSQYENLISSGQPLGTNEQQIMFGAPA
ncbi:MAG: FAD-dependent oxidoreductase [Porticoccaceae bacterium]